MNKIFRTVWNHHRRQIVVVNENTTSHSQATGSTETSSVETFVAKAKKILGLSLLAAAVSSCFAMPAQASWITDNGGKNGTLDWTVGTAGTTTWTPLQNKEFEILMGETLNVGSIGSNYTELTKYTLPNVTAGNRIINRGTYNILWTGNQAQAGAENEGNFIDNYGTVNIVMNQTPNFGAENTQPNGEHNHNIAAWEIYKWNMDGSDTGWLKDKPAFYNRQGANFNIDINVDSTKLTSDKDASKFGSTITGLAINGAGDRSGMAGKNAGHITLNIENAGARIYGLYLMEDGNSFVNEKTGVFDITTTYEKPPENFLDSAINSFAVGIKLGKATALRNEGKFNIDVTADKAYGVSMGGADAGVAHLTNAAGATMTVNATADSKVNNDYALLFDIGTNDVIDNYGTIKGTSLAKGNKAQGFGFNNANARLNNYAGSVLDLVAKAVATTESPKNVTAEGVFLDGGEQFINNGKATLTAIVDGAGTEKVANGWAIDGRDAGTLVSNTDTLNLNYTGAMGGGLFLTSGAAFENSKATTITVTRPKDETVRTSLKGIYLDKNSQVTNSGNLTIAMNGSAPNASANSFRNQGGDMTGIAVLGNDESVLSLLNKKGATIAIDMTIGNSAKDQTNGIRGYGMSIVSNTRNEGTIDATVTANYGQVSADFEPFSAVGFNIDGEKATNELNLPKPRIENTGVMKADVTYTAQGMTPSISPSKAKGWAMGFNMHGTSTFVNDGTLEARSHSTVLAKGASVQGSDFINNKDAVFEAEATGDGSFAAALQVGRPNGEMVEVPSYVLNDVDGTLTLTATAPKGGAHGVYQSAGKIENKGTITVSATGKNVNGVHLSKMDLERSTAVNPEFLNVGNLTITANALEAMPTESHTANGLLIETGKFTNTGSLTANVDVNGTARGIRVENGTFANAKGATTNLNVKSERDAYTTGFAAGVEILSKSTFDNAGALNIDLESHAHFIKGFSFKDKTSTLKNTGTITIVGVNHGDGQNQVENPSLTDVYGAYGIFTNSGESFSNGGNLNINVQSKKGKSHSIVANSASFANEESGNVNLTVKVHEDAAYGIQVNGASGSAANAGTLTMDVTGGTTEKGNAYGIAHRAGSYVGNTGNMTFNLHGVTSAASNAEVGAIVTTGQGTKFKNSGRIDITGRRTGDIVTSGDVLGIRVADKGVFDNAEAGVITIDLGPTGNKQAANYYAVQVLNGSTFGNAGTVNITLDHEADNLGAVHGLLLASDAVVNNTATGSIKIDVSPEDVGLSDVLAINGQEATIRNYGTIETNGAVQVGSIVGSSASLDGGTVKFTGKDAVSTVTTELKTGTLENAGTLTVGAKDLPNWAVNVYDLKNTGTLNAGTLIALNSIDNTGVLNLDTTQRIAIGLYGKDAASGEHVTLVNRESGQLSINVDADSALLIQTGHVAGIDLFSPTNAPDLTGGDFTNFGTTNITVKSERGTNYGIVADSTHESTIRNDGTLTIDVTQTAADATYGVSGIRGNHNTTLVNNGTLSIEGATAGDGYLQGVVLYGSETSRGSFRNDGTTSITLSANDGLDPATATNAGAIGLHLSYGDGVNTGDMTLDIAGLRTDAIKLENGSTFTNSGSITVNSKASEGNDQAIFVISGSTFTNTESGHFTYNYINEDPLLKTASSDGLSMTGGSSSVNQGTIDIHLKDLAQRETGKFMKGFYVGDKVTFTNSGVIKLTSETLGSAEAIDGAVAVNGVFENLSDVTLDVTSHGSDRQVWVGVGTLNNKKNLTVTALNDGNGDVVGFMHDWKFTTPDVQTLHVSNEKDMTLTLTANAGDAMVFDMQGSERFDNTANGVVTANVSGGTAAKGFVLGDTTIFANDGTLNLTLTGLAADATLAGFEALSDGMTATNSGDLTITLAGNGKTAAGLKSDVAGARFVNNDTLAINATGSFENLTGIDWAGEVANAGTITTNAGLNIGSVTGAGSLTVTGGDVRVGSLTDQQSVTLRNVGSAAFDTISMKSGTLSIESGKTTAKVTGTSTLKHLTNAGNLTLGGTLTLGASGAQGSLTNTGTLTMGDAHVVGSVLNSGTFTSGDMDVAGSVHNTRTGVMQTGTLTVNGALDVNASTLTGDVAQAGATTVTNGAQVTSSGKTMLASLTMTNAKDSAFGELTVTGDVNLTNTKLDADLRKAGNVTLEGATLASAGATTVENFAQTNGTTTFGDLTAKTVSVTDGAFTTAGLTAETAAFAGKTSQVTLNGLTTVGTLTATGTNVKTSDLVITDALTNDSTLTGKTFKAQGTDGKQVVVTNAGTLTFSQGSGSVAYSQTAGAFNVATNNFANSTFDVKGGTVKTNGLGKGNAWTLGGVKDASVLMTLDRLTSDGSVSINEGATLETSLIALDGKNETVVLAGGTLATMMDQIFDDVKKDQGIDIGAGKPGDIVDVEGLNAVVGVGDIKDEVSTGIGFNAGTVAFNDKVYSLTLAADVLGKLEADDGGDLEVVFNGRANVNQFTVDVANGIEATQGGKPAHAVFAGETLINADKTQPDLQYAKLVVGTADPAIADAHNLTQSMGFMNVTGVADGLFIRGENTEFVLVGVDEKAQGVGDIHNFMLADGAVDVGEGAAFTMGSYGKALGTEGKLTAITNNGTVNVKNGVFTVESLTGNGTLAVSDKDHAKVAAALKATTLEQAAVNNFGTIEAHTMTVGSLDNAGTVNADTLTVDDMNAAATSSITAETFVLNGTATNAGTVNAKTATVATGAQVTNTGSWTGNALDVDGTFVHNGKTLDVATATIDGTLTNAGAADIDALTINGHVDQTGSLTAKGVTVADNADIANNGSLITDTLTLKGAYAGKGDLTVNVKTDLTGSLVSTADGIKLGDLTVTDGDLTALNLTTGNATVTGKSTVTLDNWTGKTVTLSGTTAVADAMTSDALTTTGTLTAGNLTTKTLEQSGTLRVTKTLTADNATLSGKATVDGLLDVDVLTQKSGELVAQNVDATEVSLSGKADVGTLASDTLTVSGSLEADEVTTSTYEQTAGSADIGTLTSTTLANAGDMTVGTMDAALANTGTLTIKTGFALTGSNAGTITAEASKGTLTDFTNNGTASFGKTTATGLANNGTITFADATLEGANNNTKDMSADILNVKGSLTTTGTLTAGNTTVTGTLSVNGGKTSLDALNLKGTLGTKGELTARKAEITGSFNLTSGKTTIGNATVNKGHVNVAGGSFHADAYTQKGGSLTLAQGGSFTSGNLIVSGSDITLGDAALNAEGSIKDSNITITAGNWADNLLGLTNTDKGALGDNDFTLTGGVLDLGDKTLTSSGSVTMTGGTLVVDKIALDGKTEGVITVGGKGSLQTSLDQIFHDFVVEGVEISATNWEEGWGGVHGQVIEAATDVGDIKSSITTGIKFEGGSLSFTDEAFRTDLVAEVGSALADAYGTGKVNVEFLGHAVDDFTLDTIHKLEQDGMADKTQGLVFAGDDLINNSGDKTLDVGKAESDDIHMNTGFAGVTDTDRINIKDGLEFVLVGKTDKDGKPSGDKLLSDAENGGSVHVNTGTLTLGSNGVKDKTGGTLAEVVLDEQGNLVIKNGDFTVERIESDGTLHVTGGGSLTSNDVTLDKGDNKIDEGGVLVVEDGEPNGNLHIKGDGALTNEGTLIAGGKDSHVDTLVDGDLVNKGTGLYDDMTITNGGHYHNTSTGKDAGDCIDVAEGGKWTNDGQSSWGQVDINGQFENNGGLEIGDDKAETDDFHVGPEGSVDQNGQLDASNAGHAQIDGSFTTGELTPEGKPDDNAWSKFDDVTVGNGGHLENNGTELGNGLVVDQGGEYVNNGHSNWGSVDIAGNGDNNGDLTIRGDGKDDTSDFIVEGSGSMTNDGTLIAGGEDTKNDTLVEGDLVNKGTGLYDDMTITNGGHYHNTSTGKDQGDKIDVAEGGKWTNDGQSSWGQVDINGGATNNGDLIIGNGNDKDDDFHIGPDGSLENNGHIDAGNSGTADIEGDLINGSLTPEGKPDEDATIKFEDAVVHPGGKLENNGTEEGDSLVVENDGEYINNGNSNWNDVTINEGGHGSNNGKLDVEDDLVIDGIFDNDGTINAGNTVIGGDFNQTDDGVLNTGDLTVRPGGDIDMDKGEINVSGDLNLNGANVVIGNWKALSPDNRVSPTWSAEKPLDGKLWVIGNGDLTFGTASDGFADKIQKFDEKVPGLTGAAARVTVGQTVTMGKGSSLAVGSNVWNPAKDEGRVEMKEGSVYFGRDSYVLIDIGSLGDAPAFATTVEGATATVEHGASLVFGNLTKTGEFTLLEGFDLSANLGEDGDWKGGWDGEDLYIVNDDGSGLDYFIQLDVDKDGNKVSANVDVADLETVYPDIVLPGLGNEALQDCAKGNDSSFICGIVKDENLTVEEKTRIINSVAQIASVGGTTASAYADMGLVSDVLEDRLSFTGPTHKDGQLLQIPATDALWVEVIGGKTKTGSLALSNLSGGVKSDTYGVMIGADALMPKPAVKVGGAFSYLSGSLTSTGSGLSTTNDYDTYGAHLYAAWTPTTKFNLVGHVDWMLQDSDISMSIGTDSFGKASAKPNVNVAQAGIRAEVRETVGVFDIVPHVGLRAVYTKTDDFKTKIDGKNAFRNALEDTFTVQMPIGLTVSGYVPAQGGWTVAPKADITFVPQLGDTDQTSTVRGTAMSSSDSVNGAFAGEYYGQVKLGLTMINPKADTSFGGTVGYARGDAGKKDLTFGVQFTKNF